MKPVAETATSVASRSFPGDAASPRVAGRRPPNQLGGCAVDLLMALIGAKREVGNSPQLAIKQ